MRLDLSLFFLTGGLPAYSTTRGILCLKRLLRGPRNHATVFVHARRRSCESFSSALVVMSPRALGVLECFSCGTMNDCVLCQSTGIVTRRDFASRGHCAGQ